MSLPLRHLGKTGVSVTRLGLGGEGILRTFNREKEALAMIEAALEAGINYFESARAYSGSEAYLGQGLKGHRERIFLTSKSHGRTYQEAMAHLTITLKNLDTDHLDLWQVHDVRTIAEVEALGAPGGVLEAFQEAKQKGWTRFIGVTGHEDQAVLRRALELYDFDTVLLPVNPAESHHRSFLPLAAWALERGLGVVGMKVLCRGLLAKVEVAPVQDLVTYALSQPVSLVVIGADSPGQVKELAAAAQNFAPMSLEAQARLEEAALPHALRAMYYKT
jgi:aryl-alcohol dehydrogenase-like predicted oxidoreductase